jgi:hypothetical protein
MAQESQSLYITLLEFEFFLSESKAPILKMLNPGIEFQSAKQVLGDIQVPPEVLQLYSWKNGVFRDNNLALGEQWLFPMGLFLPIELAVERYRKISARKWGADKFPLFASWGGEFFLVECHGQLQKSETVYYYNPGAVDSDIIISAYDSLLTTFQTILECYRHKVYFYDNVTGQIEFDLSLAKEIAIPLNSNSEYWRLIPGT